MSNKQQDEIDTLFSDTVPAVVGSSQQQNYEQNFIEGEQQPNFTNNDQFVSTLDESVWATLARDAKRIGQNLLMVVFPFRHGFRSQKAREEQQAALRNWDLWGPLIFILILASTLSLGEDNSDPSLRFSICFITLAVGAVVLTLSVLLLGGQIVFFQAVCLLGYCIFPLDVAAIISVAAGNSAVSVITCIIGFAWSCWASVPFIQESAPERRKFLAIYPLILLYMFIGYLIIVVTT